MLTEHPVPLQMATERAMNRMANEAQRQAKEDKRKKDQARRDHGEDTTDSEEEEEEERPPTINDEPVWDELVCEDKAEPSVRPVGEDVDPSVSVLHSPQLHAGGDTSSGLMADRPAGVPEESLVTGQSTASEPSGAKSGSAPTRGERGRGVRPRSARE